MFKKLVGAWVGFFLVLASCVASGGLVHFIDTQGLLIVTSGGVLFAFAKSEEGKFFRNFGKGSVYFGWLNFMIALVILFNKVDLSESLDISIMGPSISISLLSVLYGYLFKVLASFVDNAD